MCIINQTMKKIVILYHKNCPDGFGGAWAAWMKFKNSAEYIAIDPHVLPEEKLIGKEIYVVDNSFSREVLEELMRTNKCVVVIDHHGSARADVEAFPQNVFDNDHSGAVLAWNYFHPGKKVPMLLQYVEDSDLWNFKLPHTEFIGLYITSYPFDFLSWSTLAKIVEDKEKRKRCIEDGKAIGRYFNQVVDEVVKKAEYVQFGKFRILAVNSSSKKFTSVIGNILAKKAAPFGVVWFEAQGVLHVSLRTNGKIDVSKVAAQFGGGGHKNAAAFIMPFTGELPWKIVSSKKNK